MSLIISEKKMVEDSMFQFEEKIKSPTARFLDSTPTFVTYFHINVDQTTVDEGWQDVASIIGHRSPIRFNCIEDFPLYGIEQIVLQIQDENQGMDTTYEGDAIILPRTVKPVQNDFFFIPSLSDFYIFRVTNIQYDTIMPDNYYKIEFKLEYIDDTMLEEIHKQVTEEYSCIFENIGTENNTIVKKKSFKKIKDIEAMYHEIAEFYKSMFYNDIHNVFLAEIGFGKFLYDPLQTEFINKHRLFRERNSLTSLILTDQYDDPKRKLKYAKSVYKFIELREMKLLSNFKYVTRPGVTIPESSFNRWVDKSVEVLDILQYMNDENSTKLFSDEFMMSIKMNAPAKSEYGELIQKFVRREELTVEDISMGLDTELIYLNNSLEVFFFTPIIMYIIQEIIKKEMNS